METQVWMYRRGDDGKVEARTFDANKLPDGWVDNPAKVGPTEPVGIVADTDGTKITPRRTKKARADDHGA